MTTTLDIINAATVAAKRAAHLCDREEPRRYFEYAIALLNEAWIAEDGQKARPPEKVCEDVRSALALFDSLAPK